MLKKLALSTVATLGLVWGVDDLIIADDGRADDLATVLADTGTQRIKPAQIVEALTADLDITATNSISILSDLDFSGVSAANMLRFIAGNGTGTGEINIGSEDTDVTLTWNKPGNLEFNTGNDSGTIHANGTFILHTGSKLEFNGTFNKEATGAWSDIANRQEMWIRAKNPWDDAEEQVYVRPGYNDPATTTAIEYGSSPAGSPKIYYLINSVAEWNKVATTTSVNGGDPNYWGTYWSKNYALGATFKDDSNNPDYITNRIGIAGGDDPGAQYYSGSFNGLGNTLYLNIEVDNTDNAGTFGVVKATDADCLFENITLNGQVNSTFSSTWADTGALIGELNGSQRVAIRRINSRANVSALGEAVGGLVGYSFNGIDTLTHNTLSGTVTVSGDGCVGGLVGYSLTAIDTLTHNILSGTVTVSGNDYVGGLVGRGDVATLTHNTFSGTVTVSGGEDVGGLVGYSNQGIGNLTHNTLTGTITISGNNYVGGLAGDPETIRLLQQNILRNVTVMGNDKIGGLVGEVDTSLITVSNNTLQVYLKGNSNVEPLWGGTDGSATFTTVENNHWIIPVGGQSLALVGSAPADGVNWFKTGWVTISGTTVTHNDKSGEALEMAASAITINFLEAGYGDVTILGKEERYQLTTKTTESIKPITFTPALSVTQGTLTLKGYDFTFNDKVTLTKLPSGGPRLRLEFTDAVTTQNLKDMFTNGLKVLEDGAEEDVTLDPLHRTAP